MSCLSQEKAQALMKATVFESVEGMVDACVEILKVLGKPGALSGQWTAVEGDGLLRPDKSRVFENKRWGVSMNLYDYRLELKIFADFHPDGASNPVFMRGRDGETFREHPDWRLLQDEVQDLHQQVQIVLKSGLGA